MGRRAMGAFVAGVVAVLLGCGAGARPEVRPATAPPVVAMPPVIVTPTEVTTEAELAARGEQALMEQRWRDAADAFAVLVGADPGGPLAPERMFDLGLALEGLQERVRARDVFLEIAGARGLARVETDDDLKGSADIHEGLDLADQLHYGSRDVLPVAVAQLRFALGELRRIRSERIRFDPLPPNYLAKLEERCADLLEAQAAYALAVRSIDPHWAAMSGYRVGEMYRSLHRDLMEIPPPPQSKTPKQKAIFYAFMHIRFRVLLEKGLREMQQTVALGERTSDSSSWVTRAEEALADMQLALADEKAQIERMPFTEGEVKQALETLQKRATLTH